MIGTPVQLAHWLLDQDAAKVFEVKERRRGRSLTQNAYYWELLGQLAHVLRMGNGDLHRRMLAEYAPYAVVSVRQDVPLDEFFRYFEVIGTGEAGGQVFNHVRVIKGSSEMDSSEFARHLDGMRQECEAQGVPFMTPEEVARLDFAGGAS